MCSASMEHPLAITRGQPLRIGIAGAGLLGRLLAWTLSRAGHQVMVFDPAPGPEPRFNGHQAAGFTAAGMLSPLAELEHADASVAHLGWRSLPRWREIVQQLGQAGPTQPFFLDQGSLLVAHGPDLGSARRMLQHLAHSHQPEWPTPQGLEAPALQALEPALHSSSGPLHAWLLPQEGQIDTVGTLQALHDQAYAAEWHWGQRVSQVMPGEVHLADGQPLLVDWAIDARGTGARPELPVRGVRGELVWLHAPGLKLGRPVRLLHPRHRVYIVPRPGDVVLVGASELESEDRSPMSLRSAVELMAAAHSILPDLAEARILRMDVNLRPALPDHRPHVQVEPGLIRLNGLYRHGWLMAPALMDDALVQMQALCRLGEPPVSDVTPP